MFLTLEEMKGYLRVDYEEDDALIADLLRASEKLCMDIARVEDQQEFEQSPNAKIAVQYAVAYQYEHREEADHHGVVIPDEFCEGSFCSRLYEEIAKRKKKICEKLQVDEDLDLEHIINCMEDFTRYMSMKMTTAFRALPALVVTISKDFSSLRNASPAV